MKALLWLLIFVHGSLYAEIAQNKAHGFHWYSVDEKIKLRKVPEPATPKALPPSLSPYEKLMEVRKQTLNKLASALMEPSFDTTYDYMKAQMGYAQKNQKFVQFWQQVLLVHPELDHSLNFPTNNTAISIQNEQTNTLTEKILHESQKHYGLILYYRGKSAISKKFMPQLMSFLTTYHFSMISVATDGESIEGLPNPQEVPLKTIQHTMDLQSRYMPALFLVNLKTEQMSPLSYGFISLSDLKERFLDVTTHYKRFSYQGLEG